MKHAVVLSTELKHQIYLNDFQRMLIEFSDILGSTRGSD
jgi:hypothetical protein